VYLHEPSDTRLQRLFSSYPERICFAGHTHEFGFFQQDGQRIFRRALTVVRLPLVPRSRFLLLPGSVGQPRDPLSWHAKYMLWDLEELTLEVRAVAYEVQATIRLLGERHFPATNARRLFW
jgi:diadenosine tetraphosphatase ApaH/serine/threonine PP2A family protein phosphatase